MQDKLFSILKNLSPHQPDINENMNLKKDLRLDSLALVQMAVKIHEEFGVDLGEAADKGKNFNTVKDVIECIKK
jgi:acyl carrier protein